ncbi:MAG: hypothetical protein ACOYOL_12600 [Chthoniobacterales bacterium]
MSGIFGWSYPPGCSRTPYDEDRPCDVCGKDQASCVCPECPECGSQGDPSCYDTDCGHGLVKSPEQVDSLRVEMDKWEALAQAEADYWTARDREEEMEARLEARERMGHEIDEARDMDRHHACRMADIRDGIGWEARP